MWIPGRTCPVGQSMASRFTRFSSWPTYQNAVFEPRIRRIGETSAEQFIGPQKNNGPDCPGPFEISFGTEVVKASVWPFLPILRLVRAADSGLQLPAEFGSVVALSASRVLVSEHPLRYLCCPRARAEEPRPAALLLLSPDARVRALSASKPHTHSSYPGHLLTSFGIQL